MSTPRFPHGAFCIRSDCIPAARYPAPTLTRVLIGSVSPHLHPVTGGYCVCRWLSIDYGISGVPVWLLSPHLQRHTDWPSFYPHRLSISCEMVSNYAAGDASWVGWLFLKDQSHPPRNHSLNVWKAWHHKSHPSILSDQKRIVFFNDESSFLF